MSLEKPCSGRPQVLEQQEHWYHYHPNSVGSPDLINQARLSAVDGSLQQGGLAWQMLSEATFKAAALNPTHGSACCAIGLCRSNSLRHQEHSDSTRDALVNRRPQMALPFQGPQDPLTCGYLSAGSTRLSMARTKAAVFPVPDCDWAIRFCGLNPGRTEMRITLVRNNQVSKCSLWVVGKGIFPLWVFCLEHNDTFFICC